MAAAGVTVKVLSGDNEQVSRHVFQEIGVPITGVLAVVREAIVAGRSTVLNVSKYVLMGASSNFGNMFSMAGAALILPFLPIQILLNNLIYNVSEVAIPFDGVDAEAVTGPVTWDVKLVERFMLVFGPISSIFDFVTFYAMLRLFGADGALLAEIKSGVPCRSSCDVPSNTRVMDSPDCRVASTTGSTRLTVIFTARPRH